MTQANAQEVKIVHTPTSVTQRDVMGDIQYSDVSRTKVTNNQMVTTIQKPLNQNLPTPVNHKKLEYFLDGYDSEKAKYLVDGFQRWV